MAEVVTDAAPEVAGDWAVDHETCMACGAPPLSAPDLMGFGGNHAGKGAQCYFKKQPATAEERARACKAAEASCCAAVRYSGTDPELRAAMASIDATGLLPGTAARLQARTMRARLIWRLLLATVIGALVVLLYQVVAPVP